jgi:glycosyltransferase involved in cell wall biosynthesis
MNKILVIIPIYNREKYLKKAIDSVLNQTHKSFELVLVDDASTDKSLEICKQYENFDNVTLLSNSKNMGCYYTRNRALYHFKDCEWDFFTIHDSDDYSVPHRLETIIKPFSDTNLLGMKTTYIRVNESGEPQKDRENPNKDDIYASEGIAIFRRSVFDILGYYDDTRFSGDTDYWWRLQNFCSLNSPHIVAEHMAHLYYAVAHEENLTKIYNFEVDRPKYFQKSIADIKNMVNQRSFLREFEYCE